MRWTVDSWGLPQSGLASRFPSLPPPPCGAGNAQSKEARHSGRAGTWKGRRPLQKPNSQLSLPLFPRLNCHLIACSLSLLPPKRHFSEGISSQKNFPSSIRARNTPTLAWGLLVTFGTPRFLHSLLNPLPGQPGREQIPSSAVGQRPPHCR